MFFSQPERGDSLPGLGGGHKEEKRNWRHPFTAYKWGKKKGGDAHIILPRHKEKKIRGGEKKLNLITWYKEKCLSLD